MNATATSLYIGPATILKVDDSGLTVVTPGGEVRAEIALGYPYQPARGDIVLVLGESDYYVVGVLKSKSRQALSFAGDIDIKAGGRMRLIAARGLELKSEDVRIEAGRMETIAKTVFQRFGKAYQWVTGVFSQMLGRSRIKVEGDSTHHAKRIVQKASGDVFIDGNQINLG